MHATSVAVAVVAAAGALAVPMNSRVFARGTTSSPATPADPSLAPPPENAFGQAPSAPMNEDPHGRALPPVTVFETSKATKYKHGEVPSASRDHHKDHHHNGPNNRHGHNREGHNHQGHNRNGHNREGHNHQGHNREGHNHDGARHPDDHDGHLEHDAPPAGGKLASPHKHKSHHTKEHKEAGRPEAVLPPPTPNGTSNPASAPGGKDTRALVKRTVDLLERYFNDLDDLD